MERKLVYIRDSYVGAARPFSRSQVKHYHDSQNVSHCFLNDLRDGLRPFVSPDEDEIYLTEILSRNDPRTNSKEVGTAERNETKGLWERRTLGVILREDVAKDGNVLPGKFALAIKSKIDEETKLKPRYVIGGHRDRRKQMMVHTAPTLHPSSIRPFLSLSAMQKLTSRRQIYARATPNQQSHLRRKS